jgi:hypothetical protein
MKFNTFFNPSVIFSKTKAGVSPMVMFAASKQGHTTSPDDFYTGASKTFKQNRRKELKKSARRKARR